MTIVGALPNDYLESLADVLASLHLRERRRREQLGRGYHPLAGSGEPIELQPGLSDAEVRSIEERLGLRFPPDLRSFLQFVVPVRGDQFSNWREDPLQEFETDQDWLLRGIWGDIDPREESYFALDAAGAWQQVTPAFEPLK